MVCFVFLKHSFWDSPFCLITRELSWHSCSMWDKIGWLNWFWQFLCEGLSSFNPKGFRYSYAWSGSLWEEKTSFSRDVSLENSTHSYLWFELALVHSVPWLFLYRSPSLFLYTDFDAILCNMDEVLSNSSYANAFVFVDFKTHHKGRLTHFSPIPHFYTPWKRQKTIDFLTFSGGIKMWHSVNLQRKFPLTSLKLKTEFHRILRTILVLIGTVFVIICDMFYERIFLNAARCCK